MKSVTVSRRLGFGSLARRPLRDILRRSSPARLSVVRALSKCHRPLSVVDSLDLGIAVRRTRRRCDRSSTSSGASTRALRGGEPRAPEPANASNKIRIRRSASPIEGRVTAIRTSMNLCLQSSGRVSFGLRCPRSRRSSRAGASCSRDLYFTNSTYPFFSRNLK
jgi:hypothetical protein